MAAIYMSAATAQRCSMVNAEDVNDRARAIMHRFVARALTREPGLVVCARRVVDEWRSPSEEYDHVAEWARLLDLPSAELARVLVRRDETMDRLRSSSPFRGMVEGLDDVAFRLRLWRKARRGLEAAWRAESDFAEALRRAGTTTAILPGDEIPEGWLPTAQP